MKRFLLPVVVLALLLAPAAIACPIVLRPAVTNYTPVSYATSHTPSAYAVQVVPQYTTILAYGFQFPAYGATFGQSSQGAATPQAAAPPPAVSPCEKELASLKAEVAELKQMMRQGAVPQRKMPLVLDDGKPFDVSALFEARCASCHEAGVAAKLGGGLVLHRNDGGPVKVTKEIIDSINDQLAHDKMPKGQTPLNAAQKSGVRRALAGLTFAQN